ncbi:MAG: DUF2059 domain-containing protein [Pseudobacteriovorax sp.]|nr:DUF2059 domain-containing protein [Pseudobacteriovorax sp.]
MKTILLSLLSLTVGAGTAWYIKPDASTAKDIQVLEAEVVTAEDSTEAIASSTETKSLANGSRAAESLQEEIAQKDQIIADLTEKLKTTQSKVSGLSGGSSIDPYRPTEDTKEAREAMAGELIELSSARELIDGAFANVGDMLGKNVPDEDKKKVNELVSEAFSWDKLEPVFYSIYSEVFTAEELYDLNQFYRSDIGKTFVEKTPELQAKTMETIQKTMADSLPKLQKEIEAMAKAKQDKKTNPSH